MDFLESQLPRAIFSIEHLRTVISGEVSVEEITVAVRELEKEGKVRLYVSLGR